MCRKCSPQKTEGYRKDGAGFCSINFNTDTHGCPVVWIMYVHRGVASNQIFG